MALAPTQPGKIITFYSYKGGTGRSMALANVACLLAKRFARSAQRVLVMDWDLEAPGLHRFFAAKADLPEYAAQPGVINYFRSLRELLNTSSTLCDDLVAPEGWRVLDQKLPLDDYIIPDVVHGVDFMRAGRFDAEYPKLVSSFDWIEFFERYGAAVRTFRELLASKYGYTLVDSRTGLTDVSGICTTLLPEKLVGVFTPNRQSLYGLCDVVAQAIEYRSKSDDFRPLSVFPLPSRVENAEKDLREQWRRDYQKQFENLFSGAHGTERCDLTTYFDAILLPHVSYYAYGENIAVLQERSDAISLSSAYQRFFERMIDSDYAWEVPRAKEPEPTVRFLSLAEHPENHYDAFLSYETPDAELASAVELQLRTQGINSFFALRDLPPGDNWAAGIATAMAASTAIVVFVGPNGTGPWNNQESLVALENCAKDTSKRIIPVLLPGAPRSDKLRLPNFLGNVQRVDFRAGISDAQAMGNLIWALTGKRPRLRHAEYSLRSQFAIAAIVLALLVGGAGLTASFLGNRALKNEIHRASEDLRGVHATPNQIPSVDDLQKLDRLQQILATLSTYKRGGVPWHLRWGLYSGDDVYPAARQIYFDHFSNMLFAETQGRLLTSLRSVKDSPGPTDSYESTYNALKAYLITTSSPEKSTIDFLPPMLYSTWATGKTGDEQTAALARSQFDFYSRELLVSNPYSSSTDTFAVGHARSYLSNFSGIDRYYLPLKADVSHKIKGASFTRQFPDAADVVTSPHDVEGAFTLDGFARMQDAIAHNRIISEDWVLGKLIAQQLDQATFQQQLTDRYNTDFVKEWRTVLQTSAVRGFGNFHDADVKLGRLISPSSPLLELLWFVSHNTHVPVIGDSFQPVQTVVPDGPPVAYILPSNQPYLDSLVKLKSEVSLLSNSPAGAGDAGLTNQALGAVLDANGVVAQIAQKFRVDQQFHIETVTKALLQQPMDHAQALIKMGPKEALNGGSRKLCADFAQITGKFPFSPNSTLDVPVDQLNALLAPNTGELWRFYSASLAQYLPRQASRYVANPLGIVRVSPDFESFFNRAAALSGALYPNGSATPHVTFTLKQISTNIEGLSLRIGADTLAGTELRKNFTWTGVPEDVQVTAGDLPINSYSSSPWAIFRFINDGHPQNKNATTTEVSYTVRQSNGQEVMRDGQKEFYTYDVQFGGTTPMRLTEFSGLRCVSAVGETNSAIPTLKPLPTVDLFTGPTEASAGQTVKIAWATSHAKTVDIENIGQNLSPIGERDVTVNQTTTYTLIAKGDGGTSPAMTLSILVKAPVPKTPSISSFTLSAARIKQGESVVLSWSTTGANSTTINGNPVTPPAGGSISASPTETTTYTLTASGVGGATKLSVTITVDPKDGAMPSLMNPGDAAAIRAALDRLSGAFATQVAKEVKQEWTGINKDQEKAVQAVFSNSGVTSLAMDYDSCSAPAMDGDTATISCRETMSYTADNQRQSHAGQVRIVLKKTAGIWRVHTKFGETAAPVPPSGINIQVK